MPAGTLNRVLPYVSALLCAWFGFANPVLQIPWLLFFYPAVLMHLAKSSQTPGEALKRGWLAGSLSYTACLYWVAVPVHFFGPLPWFVAIPCPILLGIYLGLYPALFVLALFLACKRFSWFLLGIFGASTWILLECLRSLALTGFPWLTLAQGFSPWPMFIQTSKYIGGLGLSGLITLCGIWLLAGLSKKPAWILVGLLISANLGYGWFELNSPDPQSGQQFAALIIQGNIDQNMKWNPEYQKKTVQTYLDLSRQGLQDFAPDLLLWPETAMPFYLQEETELSRMVSEFCKKHQVPLLTGAPGYERLSEGGYRLYNRAYLISDQGMIEDFYAKEHLVPFGEYLPLPEFIPYIDKLVQGVSDFSPGRETGPLRTKKLALGLLICYEIIFDDLGADRVWQESNVLVNLSNDSWFGRTSAPQQHLHQAILRAVEQGRSVVRATNSGISAVISPKGKIQQQSALFTRTIIQATGIETRTEKTFFFRQRKRILAGCLLLFLALTLSGVALTKSGDNHSDT